jgi:hypothetical protein
MIDTTNFTGVFMESETKANGQVEAEVSKPTHNLAYSPLTEKVYWIDGSGKKKEITQNFLQVMLLYLLESELPEVGSEYQKQLIVDGKPHWTIKIKREAC